MGTIVKVQIPMVTDDPHELVLVYAKDHANQSIQALDHATRQAMGKDYKAYFEAEFRRSIGQWFIGKRVKDREW